MRQSVIDDATELYPASARSEYEAEFRDDVSGLLPRELIDAAVDPGVFVRPPRPDLRYSSFCDPSGGSSDSFTCGIAHLEGGGDAVLDLVANKEDGDRAQGNQKDRTKLAEKTQAEKAAIRNAQKAEDHKKPLVHHASRSSLPARLRPTRAHSATAI